MVNFSEKAKYTLYIDPAVLKRVDDLYKQDGCKSKSEFIKRQSAFTVVISRLKTTVIICQRLFCQLCKEHSTALKTA